MAQVDLSPIPHKELPPVHAKQITMEVTWHSIGKFYIVTKITNSSYYVPGERIPPERIKLINEDVKDYPNWTISAIDYDYLAAIAGLFGAAVGVATNKGMLPLPLPIP
jgi:hypothetical protein